MNMTAWGFKISLCTSHFFQLLLESSFNNIASQAGAGVLISFGLNCRGLDNIVSYCLSL